MHAKLDAPEGELTDSMRMFRLGLERGVQRATPSAFNLSGSTRATAVGWLHPSSR